jgi:hypothetical protein
VVVDLDPLQRRQRCDADRHALVGEHLVAVLIVEIRVTPPGLVERSG